jgi:predicted glycoside hydrolase/deacetylase ChbG (UPF0249 family)
MSTTRLRINADDFGMSPGANQGIIEAIRGGGINSVSLMANRPGLDEAASCCRQFPWLQTGIHVNLTFGAPVTPDSGLAGADGNFRHGFLGLWWLAWRHPEHLAGIEAEIEAQIQKLKDRGLSIQHLDSHRHVHLIPGIAALCERLARKHGIIQIRTVNEDCLASLRLGRSWRFLLNGGLAKWGLLRLLRRLSPYRGGEPFFSMLYTGEVSAAMIGRVAASGQPMEIMVHPGIPELDQAADFHDAAEKAYRCAAGRRQELQACLQTALWRPFQEKTEQ